MVLLPAPRMTTQLDGFRGSLSTVTTPPSLITMMLNHLSLVAASWFAAKAGMQRDRGASMVEYALLIVLIALVVFVAVRIAGQELSRTYSTIADSVASN